MEPMVLAALGIAALIGLLMLGVHIGIALGLVGLFGCAILVGFPIAAGIAVHTFYFKVAAYALVTLPLFVFMGYLAAGGGVSGRLYDALSYWIGRFRGGLGIATVLSCAGFGTVTGAAGVVAAVFSKIAAPEMRRHGYDKSIAYAIPASSGAIGMLIPPSILIVVYGTTAGESIGRLLIGGTVPGLLLAGCLTGVILIMARRRPDLIRPAVIEGVTWRRRFISLLRVWPIILVAGVLVGGIFTGVFDPTEAGAVATAVLFFLVLGVRRRKSWREVIWPAIKDTTTTTCMLFLIFGGATIFSRFLVLTGMTASIESLVVGMHLSPVAFMAMMIGVYMALGTVLDGISMVCITVPLFNPLAASLGIDPIWYGLVVILALHAGLITPPVGLCVYASKAVAEPDVRLEDIFRGIMPFFLATVVAVFIMLAFPWLSTALPSLMFG